MKRSSILVVVLLGLGLVAGDVRLPIEELPPVSAAAPDVQRTEPDPEVTALLDELAWRHTGLSQGELERVAETILREAQRNGIEPALVLAVIQVESGGFNFARSAVGALGLMQLMPATAEELAAELGIDWRGPDTLFDPVINVQLGVAYLRKLNDRFGTWSTALAAYNWGPGRIHRRLRRGVALPSLYVRQVMSAYEPAG